MSKATDHRTDQELNTGLGWVLASIRRRSASSRGVERGSLMERLEGRELLSSVTQVSPLDVSADSSTSLVPGKTSSPAFAPAAIGSSTSITVSAGSIAYGQPLSMTAVVTGIGSTPTGTVTFIDAGPAGNTPIQTVSLTAGTATYTTTTLSPATHFLYAIYNGDSTFATSSASPATTTVSAAPTTVTLSAQPTNQTANQPWLLSAVVSSTIGSVPTGSVTFSTGATNLGTFNLVNGFVQASVNPSKPSNLNPYTVLATYNPAGGSVFATSTATGTITVNGKTLSTLTASTSPSNPVVGTQVTLSASVTASGSTPTGSVQFYDNGTLIGGIPLTNGLATTSISTLGVGQHQILMSYSGNGTIAGSAKYTTVNVQPASPQVATVTVTPMPNSIGLGGLITYSVVVSGANFVPAGTILLKADGGTTLGSIQTLGSGGTLLYAPAGVNLSAGLHSITASFTPSDNHYAAAVGSSSIQVTSTNASTTTLALSVNGTSNPGSSTFGQSVSLSVSVTGAGSSTPTGSVTFYDYYLDKNSVAHLVALNTSSLTGGTASFSTSALTAGVVHNLSAVYNGSSTFAISFSSSKSINVQLAGTTTTLTIDSSPLISGQPISMAAAVSTTAQGTPTGVVLFSLFSVATGTIQLGSATLINGVASLTYTPPNVSQIPGAVNPGNSYTITAVYQGDPSFQGSTSNNAVLTVQTSTKYASSTTLISSLTAPASGQSITFTVYVTGPSGALNGSVTIYDGNAALSSPVVGSTGGATLSINSLKAGIHILRAVYSGNSIFTGSTGILVLPVTSNALSTPTNVVTYNVSPIFGSAVTLSATVSGGSVTPTGTASFFDGSQLLGTATINGGLATLALSTLTPGDHQIYAIYSGDGTYNTNTSLGVILTVQKIPTTVTTPTVTPSGGSDSLGTKLTFSASVTGGGTGTISFFDGATLLGAPAPVVNGNATLVFAALGTGPHVIGAVYNGDATHATATSSAINITITPSALLSTATTLTPVSSAINGGQPLTYNATVTCTSSSLTPAGTVSFYDGTTLLGTQTLNGNGVASQTFTPPANNRATHEIYAIYNGNASFAGSNSAAASVVVNPTGLLASTEAFLVNATTSIFGQGINLVATITGSGLTPTGQVTFEDVNGSTTLVLGTSMLNAVGEASLITSTEPSGSSVAAMGVGSHNLVAVYSGDSTYATVTSGQVLESIGRATTTTSVSASPNPTTFGTMVTITALVLGNAAAVPTGTVTFVDGSNTLGTGTVGPTGFATFTTTSPLSAATHQISATYSGDINYVGSTATATPLVITKVATSIGLTVSPNPSPYGQQVTLVATLGSNLTTGTITFKDGTVTLAVVPVSNGSATFIPTQLVIGQHPITAVYSGDNNNVTATSSPITLAITQAVSTVLLGSSVNPGTYGQIVGLTATVSPGGATGTVTFMDGASTITTVLLSAGVATTNISTLGVGNHNITAVYSGDSNDAQATSNTLVQTINKAASTINLSVTPNPAVYLQSVTLNATVGPITATGTVAFLDGVATIGTASLSGGAAQFVYSSFQVGSHPITAVYSGDGNYLTQTSTLTTEVVNASPTSTALTSSINNPSFGQNVTFTANVTPSAATGGTVTFKDGANVIGIVALINGTATVSTSALSVGVHQILANYSGNGNFLASSATALPVLVTGNTTSSTTLSINPNSTTYGVGVGLTADVSGAGPTATGTVAFVDGSVTIGTAALNTGEAVFTAVGLSAGTHSLTAVYSGDNTFKSSTSAAGSLTITPATTSTALSFSPLTPVGGQTVIFTATVTSSGGTPTGTVSFIDGSSTIGTGTLAGGVATFSTSSLSVATHSISALFTGSTNFGSSPSSTLTVVVAPTPVNTLTTINAVPDGAPTGTPITISVTVSALAQTTAVISGTITFLDGSTTLGTASVAPSSPGSSTGAATFTTSTLTLGSHTLTAVYSGALSFIASTSTPEQFVVGNGVQLWVNQAYMDLLGRPADPGGLASFTSQLNSGASYLSVSTAITSSQEYLQIQVNNLYMKFLKRPVDVVGLTNWVTQIQKGATIEYVQTQILISQEYITNAGPLTSDYLNRIYQDLLGRALDAYGSGTFQPILDAGPGGYLTVVNAIQSSTEYLDLVVNAEYEEFLGRAADPLGLANFVGSLKGGFSRISISASLVASVEYRSNIKTT